MVRRARKSTRRPRRRAAGKRVARKGKRTSKQMAIIQETVEFKDLSVNSSINLSFSLSQFERASRLAPNFKWYKAAKVTWHLEPLFNNYSEGVALESVPYLYKVMNRTQDNIAVTKLDLQAMGARPIKFTSPHSITYVPNWCSSGLTVCERTPNTQMPPSVFTSVSQQGLKAQYSYLASPGQTPSGVNVTGLTPIDGRDTSVIIPTLSSMAPIYTNAVRYNGTDILFDQLFFGGQTNVCSKLVCTVTWIFKDPNINSLVADPVPVELKTTV